MNDVRLNAVAAVLLLCIQIEVVTQGLQRVTGSDPLPQIGFFCCFLELKKLRLHSFASHTEEETSD